MPSKMILIAGPYRSGTNGDAALIASNLERLEAAALAVYRLGHMPMIGEWAALPLAAQAGSIAVGDAISRQFLYPVAARMLRHCDGVLRIPGPSGGADGDVRLATEMGLAVYHDIAEISVSATDADAACVIGKPLGPA
jgi:hypothetical protein